MLSEGRQPRGHRHRRSPSAQKTSRGKRTGTEGRAEVSRGWRRARGDLAPWARFPLGVTPPSTPVNPVLSAAARPSLVPHPEHDEKRVTD